jgi:hypothetical protein
MELEKHIGLFLYRLNHHGFRLMEVLGYGDNGAGILNDFEDSNQKFKNDGFLYVQAFC